MSGESRSLPSRPNLRYVRLEAKCRLAMGEFSALRQAQAAIARGLHRGRPRYQVGLGVRDLQTRVVSTNRQIPVDAIDLGETDVPA